MRRIKDFSKNMKRKLKRQLVIISKIKSKKKYLELLENLRQLQLKKKERKNEKDL